MRSPWMTFYDPSQAEIATLKSAMFFHGLNGVSGAGRGEPAGVAEQRTDHQLVAADEADKKVLQHSFKDTNKG
jgi:hypothetical protein